MRQRAGFLLAAVFLAGCSSAPQPATPTGSQAAPLQNPPSTTASSNPVAKYIEVAGFRLNEKSAGTVEIRFAVINHSEADLGDIGLQVNVRAVTARPGDPPLFSFPVAVQGLGPSELKDVTVTAPTKLRIYELPDWQFLKADFQVTSPK